VFEGEQLKSYSAALLNTSDAVGNIE
jgi:hypothetical protein